MRALRAITRDYGSAMIQSVRLDPRAYVTGYFVRWYGFGRRRRCNAWRLNDIAGASLSRLPDVDDSIIIYGPEVPACRAAATMPQWRHWRLI